MHSPRPPVAITIPSLKPPHEDAMADTRASRKPIKDADLDAVGSFLHEHLNPGISAEAFAQAFRYAWYPEKPNNGFMLEAHGSIVGVLGAIYSKRKVNG